ncbi:MAG: O-antigen ligase family protein [Dysgonamonadaceae bacterium]|jgi:O-antigen ligase|nr:O-antigen ligase family protein [Dysgonamonadaceae bacterium]
MKNKVGVMINKIIHVLWLVPFLLVLATVFVVSDDLVNGVVSGKYFWFYASMGLVAIAVLIVAVISKKRFRFSIIDGFVLLFAGSVYLSALVFNDAAQNTTKLTILALLVVLYFSLHLSKGLWIMSAMTIALILTGLVEAIWGLRQLYGFIPSQHGLFKLTGSFFNPGPYAGYLAVVLPLALHWGIQPARNTLLHTSLKWFGIITCLFILLVLPAAMSRASWLAVIGGSLVVIFGRYAGLFKSVQFKFIKTKLARPVKRLIVPGLILLVLAAFTGMYYLKKDSADGRALIWKTSLQTIAKHPFGVGLGNFSGAYGEMQAAYFASGQASETEQLVAGSSEYGFNEYLQIAVESGIVALLLFAGIIVLSVRIKVKAKDWGTLGSLVALLIFACFSYPFSILPFLIVLAFLLSTGQWHTDDINPSNRRHLRTIILAVCCLLITVGGLWKQYPMYQAYKQWKNLQIYYQADLFEDTVEVYGSLYPYLNDQVQFLFEYAQCLSKTGLNDQQRIKDPARCDSLLIKSNAVLQRAMQISCDPMLYNIMGKNYQSMKRYEEAETVLLKSTQLVPNRLYPWYLLTKLYDEMGLEDKVRETADIVCSKEPKVQSPAVKEMREEVRKLIYK